MGDIEKLRNALEAMIRLHNGDGPSAVPNAERLATIEAARRIWLETKPKGAHLEAIAREIIKAHRDVDCGADIPRHIYQMAVDAIEGK